MRRDPHCARCAHLIEAGDLARGWRIEAADRSFVAHFELCQGCDELLMKSPEARHRLHLDLRERVRQVLTLAGSVPGGTA
jgi:hypothetical protein